MTATIHVTPDRIRLSGIDRLRITDSYNDAPEPAVTSDGLNTTSANLLFLHERYPDAVWNDPGNRLVEARAYRYMARLRTTGPGEYEREWPFKMEPKPYQLGVFTHGRHLPNVALAPCALGTGKTKMALDICADKFLRDEIDAVAIVSPNSVKSQWIKRALPEHMSDSVPYKGHVWKSNTKIPADVMAQRHGERYLRVMAFNIEAFGRPNSKAARALARFLASGNIALIGDESTRIKNYRARCTKEMLALGPRAAMRMILTGTPITKGLEDFFTQYQFLDPNIIGLTNYFSFRARYCVTVPVRGRNVDPRAVEIVGYKNQEELIRKIAPVSFMIPDSVLGLPPKRYERFEVELTPQQREIYNMLRDQLIEDLRARRIESPAMAMVRLLRMQQVLCGRYFETVETEDDMTTLVPRLLPNNRPEVLGNLLEQHNGQALIWCRFKADIDDLVPVVAGLGRVGTYEGDTPTAERDRQIQAFKDGEIDYMILNMATGSTGIDGLQCANAAFYYSNSFNREHRWQSEGRLFRLGQTRSVLIGDLVAPGTVDVKILKAFQETADLARMVIENPAFISGGTDDEQTIRDGAAGAAGRGAAIDF